MGGQRQSEAVWFCALLSVRRASWASGQLGAGETSRREQDVCWQRDVVVNPPRWRAHLHHTYAHRPGETERSGELCAALSLGQEKHGNMLKKSKLAYKKRKVADILSKPGFFLRNWLYCLSYQHGEYIFYLSGSYLTRATHDLHSFFFLGCVPDMLKSCHQASPQARAIMRQCPAMLLGCVCWVVSLRCVPGGPPYMFQATRADEVERVGTAVGGHVMCVCVWDCIGGHVCLHMLHVQARVHMFGGVCVLSCLFVVFGACMCVSSWVGGAYRLCEQRFPNPVFWNEPASCCGLERLLPWRRLRDDKMVLLSPVLFLFSFLSFVPTCCLPLSLSLVDTLISLQPGDLTLTPLSRFLSC